MSFPVFLIYSKAPFHRSLYNCIGISVSFLAHSPICSVLHKVSSVPQGISDKKHNFVLCRAIFYLCGNRFRFLCFVISYEKAQKKPPGNKGVLPLYRAACYAVTNFLFGKLYLVLFCFSLFDFGLCDNYFLILFNPFDACTEFF